MKGRPVHRAKFGESQLVTAAVFPPRDALSRGQKAKYSPGLSSGRVPRGSVGRAGTSRIPCSVSCVGWDGVYTGVGLRSGWISVTPRAVRCHPPPASRAIITSSYALFTNTRLGVPPPKPTRPGSSVFPPLPLKPASPGCCGSADAAPRCLDPVNKSSGAAPVSHGAKRGLNAIRSPRSVSGSRALRGLNPTGGIGWGGVRVPVLGGGPGPGPVAPRGRRTKSNRLQTMRAAALTGRGGGQWGRKAAGRPRQAANGRLWWAGLSGLTFINERGGMLCAHVVETGRVVTLVARVGAPQYLGFTGQSLPPEPGRGGVCRLGVTSRRVLWGPAPVVTTPCHRELGAILCPRC